MLSNVRSVNSKVKLEPVTDSKFVRLERTMQCTEVKPSAYGGQRSTRTEHAKHFPEGNTPSELRV